MQWRRYCSEDLMPFATEEIGKQWLPIAIKHTPIKGQVVHFSTLRTGNPIFPQTGNLTGNELMVTSPKNGRLRLIISEIIFLFD